MTLRDTLTRLNQEQADKLSAEADKPRLKTEWTQAVRSIISQIKDFLAPFESDGALSIVERSVSVTEEYLGTYTAPAATIEAGSTKIEVVPGGRIVFGAIGRIDFKCGRGSGSSQVGLIRHGSEDNYNWVSSCLKVGLGANSSISMDSFQQMKCMCYLMKKPYSKLSITYLICAEVLLEAYFTFGVSGFCKKP